MFQTFDLAADPAASGPRVQHVRRLMAARGLDALLAPRADEHQGEYVPASAERLKWLTGFSGSAGLAVVAANAALLLVDGRYTVQAKTEVDATLFETPALPRAKVSEWLAEKLPPGGKIGFDPWLHTAGEIQRLKDALKPKNLKLVPLSRNLIDLAWGAGRPAPPMNPIVPHPLVAAGREARDKIADLQAQLKREGQHAAILTLPESICWFFNIRGSDVAHNPVCLAFAIVPALGKPELFVAPGKVAPEARAHLAPIAKIRAPDALPERIADLRDSGKRARLDPETAAFWFARALGPKALARGADPCVAAKARKNAIEIAGARAAHVRDGAAMTRFLCWLDAEAATGGLDEIAAARQLEAFRRAANQLREISFDTISGSGPNGAIVHYRVSEASNRKLRPGDLFLIDSGGQYLDGTTDITRTVAIGEPSPEMRERFTLVLQGHIAIATARFPKGTRGVDLDPFARRALWERGLDYDHGTGHGVGSFLSVHEGPQSISKAGMAPLEPGMICSNEPGYYKEGAYGIRVENLVLVTEPEIPAGGDRAVMAFETLTLAPIDRRLIAAELLTPRERDWIDAYHARVLESIGPEVDSKTRAWLAAAAAPL